MNMNSLPTDFTPLIHVGFPKTASTWLQNRVFVEEKLGFALPWGNRCTLVIDQCVLGGPYRFDVEQARAKFASALPLFGLPGVAVVSDEILVGDPIQGKYWGRMIAERLNEIFPSAKVFICIREQKSYMLSAYKEYIRSGGGFSLERFLGTNLSVPGFAGLLQKNFLEYDLVIEHYQNLFGKEQVLVLPIEILQKQPQQFLDTLLAFATQKQGTVNFESERTAFKGASIAVRRKLNPYTPQADWGSGYFPFALKMLNRLCQLTDKVIPKTVHDGIDQRNKKLIAEWVGHYYQTSNRNSSALIGRDLSQFGYDS